MSIRQYVFAAGTRKRIPVSGTFELTPRCNLSCKMCYIRMSGEEMAARGRELTAEEWLAVGREAVSAGMIYLLLTGGEPLLRPDFPLIYTEMVKMGVMVSVNTNGTLLTPAVLDCFAQHPPEAVNVTLYGASHETYEALCGVGNGFERAVAGVRALREAGIRVQINTTFTAFNKGDMEALIALGRELDCPIRTTAYTFPPVRNGHELCSGCLSPEEQGRLNAAFEDLSSTPSGRESKRKLLQDVADAAQATETAEPVPINQTAETTEPTQTAQAPDSAAATEPHRMGCMAGRGSFWMTWDGCMLPCGMMGDHRAARGGFREQWDEVRRMTEDVCLPMACKTCAYKRLCPSCAAVCYAKNRDTEAVVPEMCRYVKTYVDTFLQRVSADPTVSHDPGDVNDPFVCL